MPKAVRHHVHTWVNHPFHGLPASVVPTADTSPAAPSQHRSPVAEGTCQSMPMSEGLEKCGLLGAGERRTHRGASPRAEERLCRKEEHGVGKEAGRAGIQAAGRWGAPHVSARIPLFAAGGWYKGPRFSRLREDRMIFTSSLAAFAHLWGTCPPQLSRSTRGSRMGLGGWLWSRDGPCSARGSAQGQPEPRCLWQGQQVRKGGGHQAPMLGLGGDHIGRELRGRTSPKVPQHQQALCCCSPACRPPSLMG